MVARARMPCRRAMIASMPISSRVISPAIASKPGVTGGAQINAGRGEIDTDEKIQIPHRLRPALYRTGRLLVELKILFHDTVSCSNTKMPIDAVATLSATFSRTRHCTVDWLRAGVVRGVSFRLRHHEPAPYEIFMPA